MLDNALCADDEAVEQKLTVIPRIGSLRRKSMMDYAFPELHQKVRDALYRILSIGKFSCTKPGSDLNTGRWYLFLIKEVLRTQIVH